MSEEVKDEMTEEQISIQEKAIAQGWDPNYEGANKKTAEQFVSDGEKINAVLKERMDKVLQDNAFIKKQLSRKDQVLLDYVKHSEAQKTKAVNNAIAKLKLERRNAIAEGDSNLVDSFDTEIQNLEEEKRAADEFIKNAEAVNSVEVEPTPEFLEWAKDNKWYENNEEMTAEAIVIGNELVKSGVYKTEASLLKSISRRIKQLFPEEFAAKPSEEEEEEEETNPRMEVEPGSKGGKRRVKEGKKSYNNLPPEAKKACDEFCKEIPGYTREKYLDSYEW